MAACASAIRNEANMPPGARLFLARASLFCDDRGRTLYGPTRYETDTGDPHGERHVQWLMSHDLVCDDRTDDGTECWRLTHFDWKKDPRRIRGYSSDAGMERDGYPPQYGRTVADVIQPNGKRYRPPVGTDWRTLAADDE